MSQEDESEYYQDVELEEIEEYDSDYSDFIYNETDDVQPGVD